MPRQTIVLAGATGRLGSLIAREVLRRGGGLRALVRPGSAGKAAELAALGAEVVEIALDGSAPLAPVMRGADAVVSTLQGGPDVIIATQLRLLTAAAEAGVPRFIPSDFSMNMDRLAPGENMGADLRRGFAAQAAAVKGAPQIVSVLNGCFMDAAVLFGFLGAVDPARGEAYLWGDGAQPMDFTTFEDTARFTAALALEPGAVPDRLQIAGDVLTFPQLVEAYRQGSGKTLTVVQKGSLADLDAEIARRQKDNPQNPYAYVPLMYWRAMLNGKGKLTALDRGREAFPVTTLAEYVRQAGL